MAPGDRPGDRAVPVGPGSGDRGRFDAARLRAGTYECAIEIVRKRGQRLTEDRVYALACSLGYGKPGDRRPA